MSTVKIMHTSKDLADGEELQVQGSGSAKYTLKNTGGVYSCTCPAWRNQSVAIEKRTCKHLKKLRGEAAEVARVGTSAAPTREQRDMSAARQAAQEKAAPVVLAESGHTDPESLKVKLKGTHYEGLEVTDKHGEGKRSVVYRARWRGRDVGVKVYKPAAIARHARKHELPLAEFEHRRNRAFFDARGMARYVAEPLGFVVEPGFQMSLQECLDGEVYYFAQREHATFISPRFMQDLTELVTLSHEAKLYDIDLHAMNVMVDRKAGGPKLFDFNQIPFTERPLTFRISSPSRSPALAAGPLAMVLLMAI
jgi:hypothetical protein